MGDPQHYGTGTVHLSDAVALWCEHLREYLPEIIGTKGLPVARFRSAKDAASFKAMLDLIFR